MSDEDHNRFIAWSFMAHGVMQSLIAVLMVAVFGLFAAIAPPGDDVGRGFFVVIGLVMFLFQAMFAVPAFVAAFALFKKRPWARTA